VSFQRERERDLMFPHVLVLKKEAVCSSKTMVPAYQTTRCHDLEYQNLNNHNWFPLQRPTSTLQGNSYITQGQALPLPETVTKNVLGLQQGWTKFGPTTHPNRSLATYSESKRVLCFVRTFTRQGKR
jgi:hypothetical protein